MVTTEKQDDKTASERIITNQPLLKILIPSYVAGTLIGKGGSIFAELKAKYGADIRISSNRECYPGTDERIVVLRGEIDEINDLNNHIMEKILADQSKRTDERSLKNEGRSRQIKIVLTNAAAGLLIGKGGSTIKAIMEETKAKLTIAKRDEGGVPGERLLTMFGEIEDRMAACFEVIKKISPDASNMANRTLKYTNVSNLNQSNNFGSSLQMDNGNIYDSMQNNASNSNLANNFGSNLQMNNGNILDSLRNNLISSFSSTNGMAPFISSNGMASFSGANGMAPSQNFKSPLKTSVKIEMEVPDDMVGSILGKRGQSMLEIVQSSRAKIQFSPKNEFAPGTTNRILTITGDMNQSKTAYILVNQKADQVKNGLGIGRSSQ